MFVKEQEIEYPGPGRIDPEELIKHNRSVLGWNAQDAIIGLGQTNSEAMLLSLEPDVAWNYAIKNSAERPNCIISTIGYMLAISIQCLFFTDIFFHSFAGDPAIITFSQYSTASCLALLALCTSQGLP